MSLRYFIKDLWQLVKDYKRTILVVTILTSMLSLALVVFVSKVDEPSDVADNPEEREYFKVGEVGIYADSGLENFQIEPALPQNMIDDIHTWDTFRAFFSLNSSNPEINATQPASNFFEESSNPIEDFLGIDPTQHQNIKVHPDTGKTYATVEINPETGAVSLVNVQEGFNDFRIQLDVDAEEGTFAENIGKDADDLVNFKVGMTPGSEQLGYVEAEYNWVSGLNFPRMLAQRKNFYVVDPVAFATTSVVTNGLSKRDLIMAGVISMFIGLMLGTIFAFIWSLFNRKIQYGFAYGWSTDDLYLKYESTDNAKQITYDMLQSEFHKIAIISEIELSSELLDEIKTSKGKDVSIYEEISEISLDDRIEEFVLIVKRNQTSKDWYHRQRKHLKTYRQKFIKIIEI